MDATIIVAIITAISAITVSIIAAIAARQKQKEESKKSSVVLASSDPNTPTEIDSHGTSKIIRAESVTGGTIIQAERIEAVHIREIQQDSDTGLRLVGTEIKEVPPDLPKIEFRETTQQSVVGRHAILLSGRVVLDIKLRNIGSQIALIKRANFRILKTGDFAEATQYMRLGISGNYDMNFDVLFNLVDDEQILSINLSQVLAPNSADRFTISIGGRATVGYSDGNVTNVAPPAWYYFQFDLVYDEDDKIVSSEPILVMLPPSARVDPIKANSILVQDLAKLEGIKSPSIHALISEFCKT